jgi:hypothetical protein
MGHQLKSVGWHPPGGPPDCGGESYGAWPCRTDKQRFKDAKDAKDAKGAKGAKGANYLRLASLVFLP